MNTDDIATIASRTRALHANIPTLDTLTALYRERKLTLAGGLDLTLTAAQRTAVKDRAAALASRLHALAASLPTGTGVIGTPNPDAIAQAEANPPSVYNSIAQLLDRQLTPLLSLTPAEREDGTFGYDFEPADAKALADTLATARDQADILIAVFEARLP